MGVSSMMKDIADHLSTTGNVNAVFGEPRVVGRKTIIPVAAVGIGFGAGGGEVKQGQEAECGAQEGGGGGGGGKARPLAVLEVTEEETRLIPVIDLTRIILSSLFLAGAATWMITRLIAKIKS